MRIKERFRQTAFLILAVLVPLAFGSLSYADSAKDAYLQALNALRQGDRHVAFMHFRTILKNYPDSAYVDKALFAIGEYYFFIQDYRDAYQIFVKYIKEYNDPKPQLFAFAYLFNIAERESRVDILEEVKRQIINRQQQVFLFKNTKEVKFKSPLSRMYKVVYSIDKIEFYVDDTLLAKISF